MNTNKLYKQKKGISPIIATLLLILIAIAAGVIVYAYVVGFIGASTSNSGGTTDTLSIDQVSLSSKATNVPVTVYIRNQGPTTESFNTGFFVKGSSLNDQLGPAFAVTATIVGAPTVAITNFYINESSSTQITASVVITCTSGTSPTIGFTVTGLGGTVTLAPATCVSGTFTTSAFTVNPGISTSPALEAQAAGSLTLSPTSGVAYVFGTSVIQGTMTESVNTVSDFTLAPQTTVTNQGTNPLSAGSTYTVQVTGTDGASTTASGKAS